MIRLEAGATYRFEARMVFRAWEPRRRPPLDRGAYRRLVLARRRRQRKR